MSAGRHRVSHEDAEYAVRHHVGGVEIESRRQGERAFMFAGLPHAHASRYIEVGVSVTGTGRRVIFHAMELTDLYRDLIPTEMRKE